MNAFCTLVAEPNPIQVMDCTNVGMTRLSWVCDGIEAVELRIGAPDGPLFSRGGSRGNSHTGKWVADGMSFFLQDVSESKPLTSANTLAVVKVGLITADSIVQDLKRENFIIHPFHDRDAVTTSEPSAYAGDGPLIVVLSGISANNVGDDAMLISVVQDIRRMNPDARITVLAENPDACMDIADQIKVPIQRSMQLYVHAILKVIGSKEKPPEIILKIAKQIRSLRDHIISGGHINGIPRDFLPGLRSLMTADGVIDCGGASLTPYWESYFYEKCLDYILASRPLFITGQGVDPFIKAEDIKLLLYALGQASEITLRERISEDYLRSIGCKMNYHTTGDDALTLLPSNKDRVRILLDKAGADSANPYLACHCRQWDLIAEKNLLNLLVQYIDETIRLTGLPIIGVPMHFAALDEREVLREIGNRINRRGHFHIIETHITPQDAKALFAGAEAAFGIGYHSAIFSLSSGTPFIGLYSGAHYAQKMLGLSQLYNIPQLPVPLGLIASNEFGRKLKELLDARVSISAHLKQRHQQLVAQVVSTRERFLEQVKQKREEME